MAEEYFPDGMTEFIFGPRGELTVDASYGKSAFPVPERTLVFPTEDHFVEFMVRTFNARIETDPETGARVPMVSTTTYGIPYAADASGTGLVDVLSPVSTFLGGPAGYYIVGGKVYCVDPDRCSIECSPPASSSEVVQVQGLMSLGSDLGSAPATSSMQIASPMNASQAISVVFGVDGGSWMGSSGDPRNPNRVTAIIYTSQTAGLLPYSVRLCGPSGTITLSNGVTVTFPGTCSTLKRNRNHLAVDVTFQDTQLFDDCNVAQGLPRHKAWDDVPRVAYEEQFIQFSRSLERGLSGYKAHHSGTELTSGEMSSSDRCWSAGCFKSNPCY